MVEAVVQFVNHKVTCVLVEKVDGMPDIADMPFTDAIDAVGTADCVSPGCIFIVIRDACFRHCEVLGNCWVLPAVREFNRQCLKVQRI